MRTGRIIGAEARVRRKSRELGPILPAQFIPLADEVQAHHRDRGVGLAAGLRSGEALAGTGSDGIRTAVNLSTRQLRDQEFLNVVDQALKNARLDPVLLELEVTERAFLNQDPGSIRFLNAMCDMGIRIAIDDFGTGYSNLAYRKKLPVDILRIDHSFVRGLPSQSSDREIVTAIVALAKSLGLAVTAEGVETAEQKDMFQALGYDDFQGFLFSKPLLAGQFS